jgi:glycosyltransferase involved in cell wall biosynthesis
MPTRNRRWFVARAIAFFQRQDYANKELIIIDDGEDSVKDLTLSDPRIRYLQLESRTSIGDKRNLAILESRGEIIAHVDDDDWYARERLTCQVTPLLHGSVDMTALRMSFIYDLYDDAGRSVDGVVHRLMFVESIHTGSISYWKKLWNSSKFFPSIDLGEDVAFIRNATSSGARLAKLANCKRGPPLGLRNSPLCVYVRHTSNTWRFECGQHLDPRAWRRLPPERLLPAGDLTAYRALARDAHAEQHRNSHFGARP